MKLDVLIETLNLDILYMNDDACNKEYKYFFASNMMSNVLLMINDNYQSTILLTGLTNVQSLMTAEMLDVDTIVYLSNKSFADDVVALAKCKNINIFKSNMLLEDIMQRLIRNGIEEIK